MLYFLCILYGIIVCCIAFVLLDKAIGTNHSGNFFRNIISKNTKWKFTKKLSDSKNIDSYYKLLSTNKELNKYKQKACISLVLIPILIISFILVGDYLNIVDDIVQNIMFLFFYIFIAVVIIIVLVWTFITNFKKYSSYYKDHIVPSVINNSENHYTYDVGYGIEKIIYDTAQFEKFDEYYSSDLITTSVNNNIFSIANVLTQNVLENDDGPNYYFTNYCGVVGTTYINHLHDFLLYITNNQIKFFVADDYIELDNQVFENKFDVFTNDKLKTVRILTPSVTTEIIELYKQLGILFEIKYVSGHLFFRLHTDVMFKPNIFSRKKEVLDISFCMNVLNRMQKITNYFIIELKKINR